MGHGWVGPPATVWAPQLLRLALTLDSRKEGKRVAKDLWGGDHSPLIHTSFLTLYPSSFQEVPEGRMAEPPIHLPPEVPISISGVALLRLGRKPSSAFLWAEPARRGEGAASLNQPHKYPTGGRAFCNSESRALSLSATANPFLWANFNLQLKLQ